jgi:peptidoglycan/xylan/chitin deacetylase (PgdA/CDA1 family)
MRCALGLVLACAVACAWGDGSSSASAGSGGVPVLVYHQIVPGATQPNVERVALERFEEQMEWLAQNGWTALSIDELLEFMRGESTPPARSVMLTFDDGWRSVLNAVPVLERHGFRASFWIITHAAVRGENLEWEEVERLDAHPLFEVGSHTAHHPWDPEQNLVTWADGRVPGRGLAEIRLELEGSRLRLEEHLGRPVRHLAWPVGWYNERLIALAQQAGYEALLTVDDGLNRADDDVLRIRRVMIDGACDLATFPQLLEDPRYRACAPSKGPVVRRQLHSPYPIDEDRATED